MATFTRISLFLKPKIFDTSLTNVICNSNILHQRSFVISSTSLKKYNLEEYGLPPLPKKPLSPFFLYCATIQLPSNNVQEKAQICAEQWNNKVLEEDKHQFMIQYRNEKESFLSNLENYEKKLTDEQQTIYNSIKNKHKIKEKNKTRKQLQEERDLGKPKAPQTPFFRFRTDSLKSGKKSMADIVVDWNKLSEAKKEELAKEFGKVKAIYNKDLQDWKTEMAKTGRGDLL